MQQSSLPLTLGRDFAGVVQAVGGKYYHTLSVKIPIYHLFLCSCSEGVKDFKAGDQVMGVIPPPLAGSHKQFVVAQSCNIQKKPVSLTMEEAASIPYAGMSAWSALSITAELAFGAKDKRVLVMGASGGVGSSAVQLLKAWGATVSNITFGFIHLHITSWFFCKGGLHVFRGCFAYASRPRIRFCYRLRFSGGRD